MADRLTERDSIEHLADEFLERHRRGELPSIEEYATAHPDLAEEIRDLFPTIAELEGLKQRRVQPGVDGDIVIPVGLAFIKPAQRADHFIVAAPQGHAGLR